MSWTARYLSALSVRDESEQSFSPVFNNYTQLADRVARLEQEKQRTAATAATHELAIDERPSHPERRGSARSARSTAAAGIASPGGGVGGMGAELADAQRARAALEAQAKELGLELEALRAGSRADQRRITQLAAESLGLSKRIRDRTEELREKAKLLDDVHNETVALTIQLNVSEEQNAKLRKENRELVARWMARMGQEADAMNEASNF